MSIFVFVFVSVFVSVFVLVLVSWFVFMPLCVSVFGGVWGYLLS